ncbi:uncharacterized protein EDB91DRAFT_1088132 [Suillus paluster]|uniref:uncharacterized protein n=1 Tax=Suillus paluster TaxID=48578 RepID=UPI001B86D4BD|nr:uncharacterized protein EDB91DRAFT_1088132 [Suillus paluster]KAG1722443.1 hypothetical protein EDB91DRAFT_1088132 [Suillus paluster]
MARSGHSTQLTSRRHRMRQSQSQKLTENEISELKNYLPEWTSAKRSKKWGMYKTWLFNNKKKKERKDMIKYGRKWMPRQVIYQQNREEVLKRIEDEFGVKPGGQDMFKHYQAVVKKVMAKLSKDELEKAKETTKEWSNNFPPPETQAQVTRKKGPVYMETMRDESNEHREVLFGMHDDNEALGDGDSFMKTKDWEDIELVWQEYAQEQFGGEAWDGGRQVQGGQKRMKKPVFDLEMDRDGMPLLPDIMETKLEEKKAIGTGICSGIDKAVVPWSAIIQSQDDFVARQYLPADVNLKEPSKLQNWDTTALLNFWYARQETGEGPTFLFKAWGNKEGDMVDSIVSEKSPPPLKRKRVMIRRPWDSSTESESEAEGPGDVEHEVPLPALKSFRGKKDAIEAPARTTWSKSVQQPSDRVTRARGKK